jgi:hypothetical protein
MTPTRRIAGIAAAPGWAARFETDANGERVVTLLAWALVEDDGEERTLVGLVQRPRDTEPSFGFAALADEIDGFSGYTAGALLTRPSAG